MNAKEPSNRRPFYSSASAFDFKRLAAWREKSRFDALTDGSKLHTHERNFGTTEAQWSYG
jgi:hypothetical protein